MYNIFLLLPEAQARYRIASHRAHRLHSRCRVTQCLLSGDDIIAR